MPNKASLHLATIQPASLEAKLYAARTAGFGAVGLIWDEMVEQGEAGVEEVRLSGIRVSDLSGLSGWMDPDRTWRTMALARAEQAFELAANLDCAVVIACPPSGEIEPLTAAAQFHELCRLAHPYGVRVGLEFVGSFQQVNTLAAAWEIVEVAEAENSGLVIDSFYFYQGGSSLDMLEPLPGEMISLVQLSDCMALPRYEMENRHRVYPGTGVLPLEELLAALRSKGYSGYYCLELHNEGYWQEDSVVVAREGFRSLQRLDLA
jgi:sugar phosphate isomerase/epimerase